VERVHLCDIPRPPRGTAGARRGGTAYLSGGPERPRARARHRDLFREVGERIARSVSTAESQEIANTMWAFATVGIFDEALISKMREEAIVKLKTFKAQEAANVAWALGRAAAL